MERCCHFFECEAQLPNLDGCICMYPHDVGIVDCSCTIKYINDSSCTRPQIWEGYMCSNRGDLDNIPEVIGVWGLIDVVENYAKATFQEALEFGITVDEYWDECKEFWSDITGGNVNHITFVSKINQICKMLNIHKQSFKL